MFDRLVESTKNKQRSRSGRFLFLTGLIYAMLLTVLAVWTIMGFSPGLANGLDLARLAPPVLLTEAPPPIQRAQRMARVTPVPFRQPTGETAPPPPETVPSLHQPAPDLIRVGIPSDNGLNRAGANFTPGIPGAGEPIPPPPPRPRPTPEPTPEVKPTPRPILKVSELSQGMAIHKVTPLYPAMGRAVHAAGPVQVQVLISEEGRVIEAEVLSGHPFLRQAALDAARQWVFRPTLLSKVPVKVQGILTFNFTLN